MSTPPVAPTQAPRLLSATRQPDGSIFLTWENVVPSTPQRYTAISFHERVGGTRPQINSVGYPPISNQQYWLYQKYPLGSGGFDVGKAYTFSLKAHGPAGESVYSNEITVQAMETPQPELSAVTRNSAGNATAVIDQRPDAPATVDAVYAYIREPGTGPWGNSVNRTTSTSQTELRVPLPDGHEGYEVAVRSHGPAGWSKYSTIRTVAAWWEEPDPVSGLEAERDPVTGDTALVWDAGGTARAPRNTIEILRRAGEVGQPVRVATLPGSRVNYTDTKGDDTRDYRFDVVVHSHAGSATATTPKLPATVMVPGAPTNVEAVYLATDRTRVTWTRTVSGPRPVSGQQVGWQYEDDVPEDPDAWTWVNVGSTAVQRDLAIGANRKIRTTVRASNAAGTSEMATPSDVVTTTPARPASLSAGWSGDDIVGTIPAYSTVGDRLVVEFTSDGTVWFPLTTLAVTARSFRHPNPTKAATHAYQAWVESDAEGTPDSSVVTSAPVAGLTKPAPPTVLPPEAVDPSEDIIIPVLHNPLDGSAQTAGQVQIDSSGPLLEMGSAPFAVLPAGSYGTVGATVGIIARTAGQSGEWSDWSPTVVVTLRARPAGTITSPTLVASRTTGMSWTTTADQVSALAELLDDSGAVLASQEVGAAVREVEWPETVLEDNGSYQRRLVIRDQYQSSHPIVQPFTVDIASPAAPSLSMTFDPELATATADIVGSEGERLELWRLDRRGVWEPIGSADAAPSGVTNDHPNPSFEAASPIPAGTVRTDEWAADGQWSIHVPVTVTHAGGGVYETSVPVAHAGDGVYEVHELIDVTHLGDGVYEMEEN